MKDAVGSACNSNNCTSAFPYDNQPNQVCAEMLYVYLPFITQNIKKTFLCDGLFFLFVMCRGKKIQNVVLIPNCIKPSEARALIHVMAPAT